MKDTQTNAKLPQRKKLSADLLEELNMLAALEGRPSAPPSADTQK